MVQTRDPMMNAIRPVVAGGRGLSVLIVREDQSVFRFAVIFNRDDEVPAFSRDVLQMHIEPVRSPIELRGSAVDPHAVNGHFAEVQIDNR